MVVDDDEMAPAPMLEIEPTCDVAWHADEVRASYNSQPSTETFHQRPDGILRTSYGRAR